MMLDYIILMLILMIVVGAVAITVSIHNMRKVGHGHDDHDRFKGGR